MRLLAWAEKAKMLWASAGASVRRSPSTLRPCVSGSWRCSNSPVHWLARDRPSPQPLRPRRRRRVLAARHLRCPRRWRVRTGAAGGEPDRPSAAACVGAPPEAATAPFEKAPPPKQLPPTPPLAALSPQLDVPRACGSRGAPTVPFIKGPPPKQAPPTPPPAGALLVRIPASGRAGMQLVQPASAPGATGLPRACGGALARRRRLLGPT